MWYDKLQLSSQPDLLINWSNNLQKTIWIGAISFEERCIASLSCLAKNQLKIHSGIVLNYPTQAKPSLEDRDRRSNNWEILKSLDAKVFKNGITKKYIDAYSFTEFQRMLDEILKSENIDSIIFDITCITKIHTLALSASIALYNQRFRWAIAYSIPENYNHRLSDARKAPGWRDIIIAPLAETALLFNESSSRGIIIPGHEADRLIVALAEIEPSGGSILIADTPKRPDFRYATNKLNNKIFRQLTRMSSRSWEMTIVPITKLDNLRQNIENEISKAKADEAPIIYFPYGPKLLIFLGSIQLSIEYPEASWFVYPIPTSYDVHYTEGIQETMWLLFK